MKKIFISHPFSKDPIGNKKKVDGICKTLSENENYIPISPLHLFSFMENDRRRQDIMKVCFDLIKVCQEVWFFNYGEMSKGQIKEYNFSKKIGKNIVLKEVSE